VAGLLFQGVVTAACVFPFSSDPHRLRLKRWWSKAMLDILGIRLDADLAHAVPGSMVVANHVSWLDIFVVNAALPSAFVSKEEVRHWPVMGWLAGINDTIFLKRGSRGHARLINAEIAAVLAQGKHVAVFPEGTTTDGTHVLHFHAALLQPALLLLGTGRRAQLGTALRWGHFPGRLSEEHPGPPATGGPPRHDSRPRSGRGRPPCRRRRRPRRYLHSGCASPAEQST